MDGNGTKFISRAEYHHDMDGLRTDLKEVAGGLASLTEELQADRLQREKARAERAEDEMRERKSFDKKITLAVIATCLTLGATIVGNIVVF